MASLVCSDLHSCWPIPSPSPAPPSPLTSYSLQLRSKLKAAKVEVEEQKKEQARAREELVIILENLQKELKLRSVTCGWSSDKFVPSMPPPPHTHTWDHFHTQDIDCGQLCTT